MGRVALDHLGGKLDEDGRSISSGSQFLLPRNELGEVI